MGQEECTAILRGIQTGAYASRRGTESSFGTFPNAPALVGVMAILRRNGSNCRWGWSNIITVHKDKIRSSKLGKFSVDFPVLSFGFLLNGCQYSFQSHIFKACVALVVFNSVQYRSVTVLPEKNERVFESCPFPNPLGSRSLPCLWQDNRSESLIRLRRRVETLCPCSQKEKGNCGKSGYRYRGTLQKITPVVHRMVKVKNE